MRRILTVCLVFCVLSPVSSWAAWSNLYRNNTVTLQIDLATQETRGMQATLWSRQVFNRPEPAQPGDFMFKNRVQQMRYQCDKRTQLALVTVYYDIGERELKRLNADDAPQAVVPGSLDERLFNVACKITPPTSVDEAKAPPPKPKPNTGKKPPPVASDNTNPSGPTGLARGKSNETEAAQISALLKKLAADNAAFRTARGTAFFQPLKNGQFPRATVLTCADSQIQSNAFSNNPDGDLYIVRNLGNQLLNNEGSVEYGIRTLKTPLLLVIGHVECSAINLAMQQNSELSPAVRRELETLRIDSNRNLTQNVINNVHRQVKIALSKYAVEVKSKKLLIIGAVYDFKNDLGKGEGQLLFVNANGDTSTAALSKLLGASAPMLGSKGNAS